MGAFFLAAGPWVLGKLKGLSPRAWLSLVGIALAVLLFVLHQRHAAAEIARAERRGAQAEAQRIAARVNRLTLKINKVAEKARENQRAKLGNIAADVRAVQLRGPGRASCAPVLREADRSGGHAPAVGTPAVAVDQVPDRQREQLIGLPFSAAVAAAGQCDADRDEVARWRDWFVVLNPDARVTP